MVHFPDIHFRRSQITRKIAQFNNKKMKIAAAAVDAFANVCFLLTDSVPSVRCSG